MKDNIFTGIPIISFLFLGIYSFTMVEYIPTYIFEILSFSYLLGLFILYGKDTKQLRGLGFFSINRGLGFFSINLVYIYFSYLYAVLYNHVHILDFLLAFKAFIYLMALSLIINKKVFNTKIMLTFISLMYVLFLIKYLYLIVVHSNPRPTVYIENNFELMFLCTLYLIRFQITKKNQIYYLLLLGVIIFLSFSRSAILMYAVIFLFVINRSIKKHRIIFFAGGIILIVSLVLYIFFTRGNKIEEMDRYIFLQAFFYETREWDFFQYMLGAPRITRLSHYTYNALSYYEGLLDHTGTGCYAAMFHSYLLRVVFDHGILGLFAITFFTYKILAMSGVKRQNSWIFIGIVLLNGLSVSSFNSVFFAFSMVFIMGTRYDNKIKTNDCK
jgi:hypothetical protein